ncbi:conserved Plasmodium protein, unknown function [Plasmodium relictum]|uniref:Exonuclease 1 n=1 Tax=Plasmodium relictum TaxID=85471 RepID=A0A1J1H7M2_PLARL|nr:conserved Plasmodium protein, unknown function [Plasmodium relictum]CRG99589.1 conserved Plasmodium protein, unknown function [Plasmodium relictum]
MRVRRLQTYLTEHNLLKKSSLDSIRNLTLGVDALYFLRTSNDLKDILCDVSGCIPPCIFHLIDKQCEYFEKLNINLIFVFDGITPKAHKLFSAQFHQNMDQGWFHYVNDEKKLSYKNFSQVSNICNSDLTFLLFHYLKSKGYKCIYAPYLAISQLSYFLEINIIDIILGPPTIVLQNIQKVILNFVWKKNYFEWVDLYHLLKTWNINKEQFIDACLLAGTEYCLTFPYLNLSHFNHGNPQFNFETSIEFIKQSPLISYLQHFPNEELRNNHIDGYCVCKTLIKFPVVLLCNGEVDFFTPDKDCINMKLKNENPFLNGINKESNNKITDINKSKKDVNEKNKKISNVSTTNLNIENSSKNCVRNSDISINNNTQLADENSEKQNNNDNLKCSYSINCNNINDTEKNDMNNSESNNPNKSEKLMKNVDDSLLTNKKKNAHYPNIDENQNSGNNNLINSSDNEYNSSRNGNKYLSKNDNNSAENNLTDKNSFVLNGNNDSSNEEKNNHDVNLNDKNGNISKNSSKENDNDNTLCDNKNLLSNKSSIYNLAPYDYIKVVGAKFPTCVYYLMSVGLISKKLLCALALGEWIDYSHPIIDSYEYRDSLIDLREYRCRILGLISIKLNPFFYKRKIKFFDYGYYINNIWDKNNKWTFLDIDLVDGFLWKINKDNVTEEMKRQNNNKIDLQFTLRWHLYSESNDISLVHKANELSNDEQNLDDKNEKTLNHENSSETNDLENGENNKNIYSFDKKIRNYNDYYKNLLNTNNQNFNSFLCLVYFMFLENLGIFTKNCGVTLFGLLLSEVKNKNIDSNILIIFELLKFGFLTTQPLLPPNGRSYPKNAYSSVMNNKNLAPQDKKSVLLLSRIYSLYNANIDQQKTYDGLIDFDLCAFFSVVKIIKKTLRQLLQACVANVLISNMELIHILPENLYSPFDTNISGFFVTHHLMGVLTKFFLLFNFDDLKKKKSSLNETPDKTINLNENSNNDNNNNLCNDNSNTIEKKKDNPDSYFLDEKNQKQNCDLSKMEVKNKLNNNSNSNDLNNVKMHIEKSDNNNSYESHSNIIDNENSFNESEKKCINKIKSADQNHISEDKFIEKDTKMMDEVNKNDAKNNKKDTIENFHVGISCENKNNKSDFCVNLNDHYDNNIMENKEYSESINNRDNNENKDYEKSQHSCDENPQDALSDNFNEFEKALRKNFPSFLDPIIDLCNAINTWRDHLSLIAQLEKHTNVYDLVSDLKAADKFLEKKIHYIGLHKTPTYINICSSYNG